MARLDLRPLLAELIEQGYTVHVTASGRWLVRNRRGDFVTVVSPQARDWRALRNALADLRRDGFRWQGR